jgi:hypothetical protein
MHTTVTIVRNPSLSCLQQMDLVFQVRERMNMRLTKPTLIEAAWHSLIIDGSYTAAEILNMIIEMASQNFKMMADILGINLVLKIINHV